MTLKIAKKIIDISKKLYGLGFLTACDGNISSLNENDNILITPSGVAKSDLEPIDLCIVDRDGKLLSGQNPSSELYMHLEAYKRKDISAVIHAHPPLSIAWTIANTADYFVPTNCMSEVIVAIGNIPIVPYKTPGTKEMADGIAAFVHNYKAMILSRHGTLVCGSSLDESFYGTERIENTIKILANAKSMGGLSYLQPEEILKLWEIRKKIGEKLI
jgi:L-fuculose-phosphate aldolase